MDSEGGQMRQANFDSWRWAGFLAITTFLLLNLAASAAEPFKLGAEEKGYIQDPLQGSTSYPAPQLMRQTAAPGAFQGGIQARPPLQSTVVQHVPIQAGVQQRVVLPANFLGVWNVAGQRNKVEAAPELQERVERAYPFTTSDTWVIAGDPNSGYTMGTKTGMKTAIVIDKAQGDTAFIRYEHPVFNTMAQEALVLSLTPGGAQFTGLERVTIIKRNEPPRFRVTYQLIGQRQR